MGIFSNLSANRKIIKRLESVEAELETLASLARTVRSLDLEFGNLYGKVKQALGRIDKRAAIIESEQGPPEEEEVGTDPSTSEGFSLTPEQAKWQKRIMAERRRLA